MYSRHSESQETLANPYSVPLSDTEHSLNKRSRSLSRPLRDRSQDSSQSSEYSTRKRFTALQSDEPVKGKQFKRKSPSNFQTWKFSLRKIFAHKYWAPEVTALLLAGIDILAIALILAKYDNRLFTDWPLPISLNALISILVTLLYMLLMSPISSSLGQLKWAQFASSERRLFDFHVYDHASKGVTGSLLLIFRRPLDFMAVAGALLTFAVAAVGPFVQQIISVNYADWPLPELHNSNNSAEAIPSVPIASKWDPQGLALTDMRVDPAFEYAVYNGLMSDRPASYDIKSNCRDTNCTWLGYSSLVVQSKCVEVTDSLQYTTSWDGKNGGSQTLHLSLSNGHSFDVTGLGTNSTPGAGMNISSMADSISFNGTQGNVLVDFSAIYTLWDQNATSDANPHSRWYANQQFAWECMLSFVQQPMAANFTNSILNESATGPAIANNSDFAIQNSPWLLSRRLIAGDLHNSSCTDGPPCLPSDGSLAGASITYPGNSSSESGNAGSFYTQLSASVYLSQFLMGHVFNGSVQYSSMSDNNTDDYRAVSSTPSGAPQLSALFYPFATNSHPITYGRFTLAQLMNNVASSMSRYLRAQQPFLVDSPANYAQGRRHKDLLVYDISWSWIALPAVLLLLTSALVAATAIDSKRKGVPVWTTNSLAALAHGPDDRAKAETIALVTELEQLEDVSKTMKVRFDPVAGALQRAETDET